MLAINEEQALLNQIIDQARACRYDPYRWTQIAWDWGHGDLEDAEDVHDWQFEVFEDITEHLQNPETRYQPLQIAVASGHGIGKSAEMGMISNWAMSCFPEARITVTANTDTQLRTKTVPEITKWFRSSITAGWFDTQAQSIKARDPALSETWRLDFTPWSEHNTEAFAGLHNKGRDKILILMFDEGSKIHDKVWEVAEGALTDNDTIIIWLVFGNPTQNSGRFRECFRRFRKRWKTYQIDSRTVPGQTNLKKIKEWEEDHGEDSDFFKVRVRGQFPSQSAKQFIGGNDADGARRRARALKKHQYRFAPIIIGVDPAWTGDDMLEIMLRQGLYSKHLKTIPRNDNDVDVANLIMRYEDEYKADAVFIDGGFGTGIYSVGHSVGRSWQLVWFGSASPDEGYVNMRAYIWGEMKKWLKAGGVIDPRDEVLYQDLIGPETVPRPDGKIMLESKENMKDRGLPSPGRGDALALTFALPVIKEEPEADVPTVKAEEAEADFDPYNR